MAVEVRDTSGVNSSSSFYRRGFYQRSARRANGDTVFITGDFQWEVEDVRRLLMKAARRNRMRMIEIAELAGLTSTKQEEALQTQLAVIETEKLQTESMELPSLGYVPEPDAIVDLEQTMENFKRDVVRCSELADDSSLEFALAVAANTYRWARFWEVRHPDPMIRAGCAANLAELRRSGHRSGGRRRG